MPDRARWTPAAGLLGCALCLQLAPPAAAAEVAAEPALRILVPPVVGVPREAAIESHPRLVRALQASFGSGVIDSTDVILAQKRARVWPNQLLTAEGVQRLAKEVDAERAVIVSATRGGVTALVFAVIGQGPTLSIPVRGVRAERLSEKDALRIVTAIEKKARLLLQRVEPSVVDIDVSAIEIGADSQPWAEGAAPTSELDAPLVASDEIREEERLEAAARAARQDTRARVPALFVATGLALGAREVALGGSRIREVIPVEAGALPCWSLSASIQPLRLLPALNRSPLAELLLDVTYRRGLYGATYEGADIPIDDDDLTLRGSYRVPLARHAYAPWFGLGAGGGWQRSELGCCIAAPSTRYVFGELHGRAVQPLYPPLLAAEAVLAARLPVGGGGGIVLAPAWQGELWLTLRAAPLFFARAGVRTASFGGWQAAAFRLDERLTTLGLEVGGYY